MKNKYGKLIVFEGGEGAGKTIQIKRLRDRLVAIGKDIIVLREPGGTVISEQIREVVLNPKNVGMAYTTEVLLFQAARSQIYRELVLPSIRVGKVVLMDRSRDSSVVYQGMVRGFGKEMIEQLNDISTKNTLPNMTILLDVPVEEGLRRRLQDGGMDRLDMEKTEFHEKVRESYLELARSDTSGRWIIVDASMAIDQVEESIWSVVQTRLE